MSVTVSTRAAQASPLSWAQVDANFTALANAINVPTFAGGPTSARPSVPSIYQVYVDTTLGFPVFCTVVSPATWVNAAGVVS